MIDDDIFPGLEAHMAASEAKANVAYDVKMLRLLIEDQCDREQRKELEREAGDEFGFLWFNANWSCPITLRTSKVKVVPIHLVKSAGMTRTPLWQAYFELKSEYERGIMLGMIFRVPIIGQYVIHNDPMIPPEPGFNIVVRQASNPDKSLYVTPWRAFLAGLKKVWTM